MTARELPFGVNIGRYRVIRRLGAGGMAEVFLAHDPGLKRNVAIKVLAGDLAERPGYRMYLEREARAVARLNHPNVAQVYDVLEFEDRACFVMEYLEGQPLSDRVRHGALPLEEAVRIGRQVAAAVAHAHAHGILHCDLKPGNVFLTADGTAKVLDFGLARPSGHGPGERLTDVGASPTLIANRAGTFAYMPPELYAGHALDERSDVYGIGLILAEISTGHRPPAWPVAMLPGLGDDTTREMNLGGTDVPPPLQPIVRRALAPLPQDRYQSAAEMVTALQVLEHEPRSPEREDALDAETLPIDAGRRARVRRNTSATLQRTLIAGVAAAVGVTLLGIVNSAALNLTLGRAEFASEGLADWFVWGLRSTVAPAVLSAAVVIVFVVAQSLVRTIGRTWFPALTTSVVMLARRTGARSPSTLAQATAIGGAIGLAAIYWRFKDLIAAFMIDISTGDLAVLARLREANEDEHRHYRMLLTLLIVTMVAALWHTWTLRDREPPRASRPGVMAAAAVLGLSILLFDLPYRILYQVDRFQIVQLAGQSCFVLGERGTDLLVYCPLAQPPRNRTVRRDDPRVVLLDCYGRVFDPPSRCDPRQ